MRLSAFEGEWELTRDIDDARAGQRGRFVGRARFTPAPEGLRYREEGALTLGDGPALAASRDYLWRAGPEGAIDVLFADGRLFHSFRPADPAPAAEHDCPPDLYRVRYDFAAWPRWQVAWRVSGPRKDYDMLSRFRPAGAP
ncbi:DUF6314 family protein [Amaricoccus sp.]|uniref:DUF6314 family protein n=1 Tax=Amaricoccus sp. TaxID=1872485 RepID=UPI001B600B7D|nr:DUF6314 family protein [Amaricoccus sp.]MBP7002967.1 trigger factor [Amaricoccus sp.]